MVRNLNKQYGVVDIVKFLCAILIVCTHYISEYAEGRVNVFVDYGISLYIIAVPFFFASSGYFLFSKTLNINEQNSILVIKNYIKKIIYMYAGWSLVYLIFKVSTWIKFGITYKELFHYLINAIAYSTYQTIWFLPALIVGIVLTNSIYLRYGTGVLIFFALLFYSIGALGVSYSFLLNCDKGVHILESYNWIFVSTRNGIFNAFPFVSIGFLIAKNSAVNQRSIFNNLTLSVIFGVGFLLEAIILKYKFEAVNANTLILLLPFTYYFLLSCLKFQVKSGVLFKWMRKMSTVIFLCQRLFLSAIPELFPNGFVSHLLNGNPLIGLISTLLMVIILSEVIIILGNKNKFINMMS